MGRKPRIAWIGLVLAGSTLTGCESDAGSRRPLSQSGMTASAARTTTPSASSMSAWGSQARTSGPVNSTGTSLPATGMASTATNTPLNLSPTMQNGIAPATAQTTAQFPGMPAAAPSTGSLDPSGRITNPTNVSAPAPQGTWASGMPAAGGTGMKTSDPAPVNAPQTQTTYQTRYPELQPPSNVPTMPKPGQGPNE